MDRWRLVLVVVVIAAPLAFLHCSKDEAGPATPSPDAESDAPAPAEDAEPTRDANTPLPLRDAQSDGAPCSPPPALDPNCFATGAVYCLSGAAKCSSLPSNDCPDTLTLDCTSNADCARFGNPDLKVCCMAGRPPETPPPANCSTPRIVPIAIPSTNSATFCATMSDCVNTPRGTYTCTDNADCPTGTCQKHVIVGTSVGIGLCK